MQSQQTGVTHVAGSTDVQAMRQLAGHWDIPLTKVVEMVGVELAEQGGNDRIRLNQSQARVLGALREIDLTLLLLYGEDRSWLKKRSRARALGGRPPLDCIRSGDAGSAAAVHQLLLQRCAKVPSARRGTEMGD